MLLKYSQNRTKSVPLDCWYCQRKHFSEEITRSNSAYLVWQSVKVNRCEFDLSPVIREDITFLLHVSRVRNTCIGVPECLGSDSFFKLPSASL